ncbi:triose phosphate transporter [Chytriomyces cf. hyalinus JEL632]|nr:triose phosphate transporter [Chytriomyces cf. hyalinus JEL632]
MHPSSAQSNGPLTDAEIRWRTIMFVIYAISWYSTSLSLSLYNKWLFSQDHMNFAYPLFTSTIHMVIQFVISGACLLFIWPSMRPTHIPTPRDYFLKVLPCGMATGLDIGLSNSSLKVISLSFYTMVKSGAPVFVLLFAFLFRLEKPTWKLTGIILIIVSGVLLMVGTETKFNLQGYLEVQTATILSGFRWSITTILLAHASLGMSNPLATSLFLSPVMAASLLVVSLSFEDLMQMGNSTLFQSGTVEVVALLGFGGVLAFLMVMAEFQLIRVSSVVAFSIAGVFKEVLTIFVSVAIFKDGEFTLLKICGLILSLGGIGLYNYVQIQAMREEKDLRRQSSNNLESRGKRHAVRAANDDADQGALLDPSGLWSEGDDESEDEAIAAVFGGYNNLMVRGSGHRRIPQNQPEETELVIFEALPRPSGQSTSH